MPPDDQSGDVLQPLREGRYVDFLPVGEGGMGLVYWAVDTELRRQVAFKVIRPSTPEGGGQVTPPLPQEVAGPRAGGLHADAFEALRRRFLQEARVTGAMQHPGIVPVYEVGATAAGIPYYTMRFIAGNRTLADAIAETAARPVEARLELLEPFLKVCDTVRYAHDQGVLHRDLKPQNIALGEYGEVVVLDWGLAKLVGAPTSSAPADALAAPPLEPAAGLSTSPGAVGTPGYMAPEACAAPRDEAGPRSDVWSLGAVLFEILTGRRPFAAESLDAYRAEVQRDAAPSASDVDPGVPAPLSALLARMLSRAPADRPRDLAEVADTIRRWQRQRAVDREVEGLLREVEAALGDAQRSGGGVRLRDLDRAAAALRRASALGSADPRLDAAGRRVRALRELGMRERERGARRQVLRRAGLVALVVAVVAGGIVAWMLESRRRDAEEARRQATAARDRAEGVMAFVVGDLQQRMAPIGRLDVLGAIEESARAYYESLPLEGSPVSSLRNRTRHWINTGEAHAARGHLPDAVAAFRKASEIAAYMQQAFPAEPDAAFYRSVCAARLGRTLFDQGQRAEATPLFQAHLANVQALLDAHPDREDYRGELATAWTNLGLAARTRDDAKGALHAFQEAHRCALEQENRAKHDATPWRFQVLELGLFAARARADARDLQGARQQTTQCVDEVRTLRTSAPGDVRWIELDVQAHLTLGWLQSRLGSTIDLEEWSASLASLDGALPAARQLAKLDPLNMRWAWMLSSVQRGRGDALVRLGRREEALACQVEAGDLLQALVAQDPSNAPWRHSLATQCDRVAALSRGGPEHVRSRSLALEQAEWLRERDPEDMSAFGLYCYALSRLGFALVGSDPARARECYERSDRAVRDLLARTTGNYEAAVLYGWMALEVCDLLAGPEARDERLAALRKTVAAMEAVRAQVTDEPSLHLNLTRVYARLVEELSAPPAAPAAQIRAEYAHLLALERHWTKVLAREAVALAPWMEQARRAMGAAGIAPPASADR